jgi:hypothetical protein
MLNILREATKPILRFQAKPWPFQRTFKTPLKDLERFVSTIIDSYSLDSGVIWTNEVVFEPGEVLRLLEKHSIQIENRYKFTLQAKGQSDIAELLEAVLGDWIDFLFLPVPELFAIYADHDEFATFFFPTDSALNEMTSRLEHAGFLTVQDYMRDCSDDKWQ